MHWMRSRTDRARPARSHHPRTGRVADQMAGREMTGGGRPHPGRSEKQRSNRTGQRSANAHPTMAPVDLRAGTAPVTSRAARPCDGSAARRPAGRGVGVRGRREQRRGRGRLDDTPCVQDRDAIEDPPDDAEVVRDEQDAEALRRAGARRAGRGSAPRSSRRAPSSARPRSGAGGGTGAPSRASRAAASAGSWCGYASMTRRGSGRAAAVRTSTIRSAAACPSAGHGRRGPNASATRP